jgi:hypothetical protein
LVPIEAGLRPLIPALDGPAPVDIDARVSDGGDHAKVDLPGIRLRAQGDKAEVRVFGIIVNANGENADINLGQREISTIVQAGVNGAEVRLADVGEGSARLMLALLAEKVRSSGFHAADYLARGPVVVASFRSPAVHQDWRRDLGLNAQLDLNVND